MTRDELVKKLKAIERNLPVYFANDTMHGLIEEEVYFVDLEGPDTDNVCRIVLS